MAEEGTQAQETTEEQKPQEAAAPQGDATDWKAEARKWEERAKKSKAAEDELEALKQAQMTEQEKANARAEKAESELAAMKAEAERVDAARRISEKTGVPLELLEFCADAEAMERFAKVYEAKKPAVHAAPRSQASNVVVGEAKSSNGELFAQAAKQFFKD